MTDQVKTKRDKIAQLGAYAGHIAVIAVIAVPILSAFGYNPFYMKADAQALAENVASNTSRIKMVEQRLEGIEETTAWNLQITLQNSLSQLRVSLNDPALSLAAKMSLRATCQAQTQQLQRIQQSLNLPILPTQCD
jgi:type IV secretory pathway VirB2 component (pilin)